MSKKYVIFDDNGNLIEAELVSVKRNGQFVGWIDPAAVDSYRNGEMTDDELCYDAAKRALPPSGKQIHSSRPIYRIDDDEEADQL